MKVYRISKCDYITDLEGTGAARYPGRWNSKGTYVLYTAATPSLALLESVVHLSNIPIQGYCMICLQLPDEGIGSISLKELPVNWHKHPPADTLKTVGDNFVRENKFLALRIPSAIMPEDNNYLINPAHPAFKSIRILYQRTIAIDERLFKK